MATDMYVSHFNNTEEAINSPKRDLYIMQEKGTIFSSLSSEMCKMINKYFNTMNCYCEFNYTSKDRQGIFNVKKIYNQFLLKKYLFRNKPSFDKYNFQRLHIIFYCYFFNINKHYKRKPIILNDKDYTYRLEFIMDKFLAPDFVYYEQAIIIAAIYLNIYILNPYLHNYISNERLKSFLINPRFANLPIFHIIFKTDNINKKIESRPYLSPIAPRKWDYKYIYNKYDIILEYPKLINITPEINILAEIYINNFNRYYNLNKYYNYNISDIDIINDDYIYINETFNMLFQYCYILNVRYHNEPYGNPYTRILNTEFNKLTTQDIQILQHFIYFLIYKYIYHCKYQCQLFGYIDSSVRTINNNYTFSKYKCFQNIDLSQLNMNIGYKVFDYVKFDSIKKNEDIIFENDKFMFYSYNDLTHFKNYLPYLYNLLNFNHNHIYNLRWGWIEACVISGIQLGPVDDIINEDEIIEEAPIYDKNDIVINYKENYKYDDHMKTHMNYVLSLKPGLYPRNFNSIINRPRLISNGLYIKSAPIIPPEPVSNRRNIQTLRSSNSENIQTIQHVPKRRWFSKFLCLFRCLR